MDILQIENLSFSYPTSAQNALNNISFCVKPGEFITICGESGCGKSTLLRLIKREIAPFGNITGKIYYCGTEISKLSFRESASQIGFILQNPESQIVTDTVKHELAFTLESLGLDSEVIRRKIAETACYFGIEHLFSQKCAKLSGGEKQLINLAGIMASEPKLLLLDEPTSQLDPIAAKGFITKLKELNSQLGVSVIIAEHRTDELFEISDKVLFIKNGENVFFDTPKRCAYYFAKHPNDSFARRLLPSAARIYTALENSGDAPLSVKQCREYISQKYSNKINTLEIPKIYTAAENQIEFKDVYFRYDKNLPDVLKGASFSVKKGEHFCLLGGNGSGKTTALSIAARLLKPYHGKVLIGNKNILSCKNNELYVGNIALLPQNPQNLFVAKTLLEDLRTNCNVMQYSEDVALQKINELADFLEISHLLSSHPYDLSGGEQQKAALAKVLLLNPKILLLDEPTKGIDVCAKAKLIDLLKTLKEKGMTILNVTHDVEFAAYSADRVGLLFDGQLVSSDTPNSFFSQNSFYTTAASRISKGIYQGAVLCEQVVELCVKNRNLSNIR